jgi:transcription antitermination factor NusG
MQISSNIEQQQWYALYVNSRAEKKVMQVLLNKNIEAYVPLVKNLKQWSDRKKMVEAPLFTGYVFVKINSLKNQEVLQTKGVVNFVRHLGQIASITDVEINRLKQIASLGYYLEAEVTNKKYNEGERIRILSGPLKNIEGFVLYNNNEQFIEVLLESIGYCIKVKLPQGIIESVSV